MAEPRRDRKTRESWTILKDKTGKITRVNEFHCHVLDVTKFIPAANATSEDGAWGFHEARAWKVAGRNAAKLSITYIGFDAKEPESVSGPSPRGIYSEQVIEEEVPITRFYRYRLVAQGGTVTTEAALYAERLLNNDPDAWAFTPAFDGEMDQELIAKITNRIRTVTCFRRVWSLQIAGKDQLTASDYENVNQVDTPRGSPVSRPNRNWLKRPPQQVQQGNVWLKTFSWEESNEGNWDPDIYGT